MSEYPLTGITIAGTGNVAWNLGHALVAKGIPVAQVLGRNVTDAETLARALSANEWSAFQSLSSVTNMCIVAVSDDAISSVTEILRTPDCLFLHTAGSIPMAVFEGKAENFGVLYPLQTLSKDRLMDFVEIPLLIEANSPENLNKVRFFAEKLSARVQEVSSAQRLFLHLAAVIANNFSNHLFYQAENLLKEHGLDFDLLHPLIAETAQKAILMSPAKAQTGPAARGNRKIMEKHLKMLADKPELAEIYRIMSKSISEGKVNN